MNIIETNKVMKIKHGLLIFLLIIPVNYYIKGIVNMVNKNSLDHSILLVTISGLILAGAIAGYFQFSFSRANDEETTARRNMLLKWGHTVTFAKLFVIGSLLLVCIHVSILQLSTDLGSWVIGVTLYFAMVGYDVFDFYAEVPKSDKENDNQ